MFNKNTHWGMVVLVLGVSSFLLMTARGVLYYTGYHLEYRKLYNLLEIANNISSTFIFLFIVCSVIYWMVQEKKTKKGD